MDMYRLTCVNLIGSITRSVTVREEYMLQSALTREIGIRVPVFSVGMGWIAGPELASAISNAGACGVVGLAGTTAAEASSRIRKTRTLTDKPFGVNIILARLGEGQIEACLDARVPLIVFFWGDPGPYVKEAHLRGVRVSRSSRIGQRGDSGGADRCGRHHRTRS